MSSNSAVGTGTPSAPDTYLSVEQAAQVLGTSREFIALRVGDSKQRIEPVIPFSKIGTRTIRIRRSDLDAWVAARTKA